MTSVGCAAILVVPCYNEALRLNPEAFLGFLDREGSVGLVLVDDGSVDDTWKALESLRCRVPDRISTLRLPQNSGKAEAVRRGLLLALELGSPAFRSAQFLGYWDADLATPLTSLALFLEEMAQRPECMLVMGSRVRLLGRTIVRNPVRHYVGRVYATLASLSLDLPVYDTQCGAKLFRVCDELLEVFSKPFSDPWIFDVEILARFKGIWGDETAARVVELPLPHWEDVHGSKVRAWDGVRAAAGLMGIWYNRLRGS